MKPERHFWDEGSTHRAVAGKEYDEVWDYAEQLEAENEHLSYLAYGPRHDADCPALWGAGNCKCDLGERTDEWTLKRAELDALLTGEDD